MAATEMKRVARIADGRTDLVFEHVSAGHSASSTDSNGVSLIKWCAYHGDVSAIRFLMSHGESLASLGDNRDLNGAAFHGHWKLCQFLAENGADVNHALPDTGETPLHAAACIGHGPAAGLVVQVLLSQGADPGSVTHPGVETGSFMRDCRTRGETPLHRAAAFGSLEMIQMLLDAGARIDARDMHGDSPLSWASWYQRPAPILRQLCFAGFAIHPEAPSVCEHGGRESAMALHLLGKPHLDC